MVRTRTSGRRTDYQWTGLSGAIHVGQTVGGAFSSVAAFNAPGTLTRSRGEIMASMDVGAANDAVAVSFGLMIMSDDQVTAGITAMPSPSLDLDGEWLWHGYLPFRSETGTQSDDLGSHVGRLTVDSKAMRRVKQNSQIVAVHDGVILAGTPTYDVVWSFRILLGV